MSAASIGSGKAGGYARYLEGKTLAPQRGDYYLRTDGSVTEAPGRWLSEAKTLEGLGVSGAGPLEGPAFVAVMEGRHPQTGRCLRVAGADGTRGGGIDVTFSAPKSVSVVWALSDDWQRAQLEAAHERAVERAVDYMRENVALVRRRYGAGWSRSVRVTWSRRGSFTRRRGASRARRRPIRSCTPTSCWSGR